ncbi:MAG TPA: ABC transporter substrate-binding protein [Chloroflexota bacterium]|jgi:peptide/nickel transport system substrate-binding protein
MTQGFFKMSAHTALNCVLLFALALTGCGVAQPATTAPAAAPTSEGRTLVALVGQEPASIAARPLVSGGTSLRTQQRVVNALLAVIDAKGLPQPELLASLPALSTPSWQVFPDGTMQTTYTLRPNLTWHDGQPLTSDDFVFGWRVYSSPDLGQANQVPMQFMTDVAAIDRDHFTIKWKQSYPDADSVSYSNRELSALPQHILQPAFDQIASSGREQFVTNPYWAQEYVGLGPYRIQQWLSGSFIDLVRFEGYALGAPKIGRIEMRFGQDANVAVASLLSGAVHFAPSLDSTEAVRQEWARTKEGRILDTLGALNYLEFQLRPEYASPSAPLDLRVRKAIAHTVDKQTLVDTLYNGQAILTDTPIWTRSAWGAAVDSSIPVYPHDLQAGERLMNQAGFTKGADGFYQGGEGRLSPLEFLSGATPDKVQLTQVLVDWFKSAGFDAQPRVIPAAQASDNEVRSTYPGVLVISGTANEAALNAILPSSSIPSASNRWVGLNRGGWSSPEYDRLLGAFNTTLDRAERVGQVRQMLRISSDELPIISLAFNSGKEAVLTALKGPASVAPESTTAWNIYEWEFQ